MLIFWKWMAYVRRGVCLRKVVAQEDATEAQFPELHLVPRFLQYLLDPLAKSTRKPSLSLGLYLPTFLSVKSIALVSHACI